MPYNNRNDNNNNDSNADCSNRISNMLQIIKVALLDF